jgi:hypothetical protein
MALVKLAHFRGPLLVAEIGPMVFVKARSVVELVLGDVEHQEIIFAVGVVLDYDGIPRHGIELVANSQKAAERQSDVARLALD